MRYCKLCVQPETRPGSHFSEDGLCGACQWEKEKAGIDWNERKNEFYEIAAWAKSQKASWDCVIGVSGGKDSTFQALYMRDVMQLRPLLVCCEPCENTSIGKKNLDNIKHLGFDTISISPNKTILKRLFRKDFFSIGNPNRPSEYCLNASVFIIADKFDIPLVVQGENAGQTLGVTEMKSAGGDATKIWTSHTLKHNAIEFYAEDVSYDELFLYHIDMEKISKKNIRACWLSNYVKEWGQLHNALFSLRHGLSIHGEEMDPYAKGQYRRFYALDHSFREVNQLLKYIKYGFGFTTDQACYDIRDGQISREEGAFLVRELDGGCGQSELRNFCSMIDITVDEFWEVANSFRGSMWIKCDGNYVLDNPIYNQIPIDRNLTVHGIMRRLGI